MNRYKEQELVREHIVGLTEPDVRQLIKNYFRARETQVKIIHSSSEHGMDVVAHVDDRRDFLRIGYNVIIQVKAGRLSLSKWRNDVLYQLLETHYYKINEPRFGDFDHRRVLLVISGEASPEVRDAIQEYNENHYTTIELLDIDSLLDLLFDSSLPSGFARTILEPIIIANGKRWSEDEPSEPEVETVLDEDFYPEKVGERVDK